jgi:predicted transposase/invertase (TIGR01784 family)
MSIHNPHDRFFRDSFGRSEIARNYLEEYLPDQVRRLLDLDTLALQDGSFVDETMREHQTDLLYQVQLTTDGQAYVYFLFEHKSYPDPLVGLQLLRYMVRIWEQQVREEEELAPLIPLVIYHGKQAWRAATEFLALLDVPEGLRPYQPNFRYHLSDFSHLSDEEIRGEVWLRVCLSVLHAIFDPHLRDDLGRLVALILQLSKKRTGLEYIHTILYYLSTATGRIGREDLQQALLQQGEQGEKLMQTIAQEFIQQGLQQGLQQGVQQGMETAMRQNILELLHLRLDVPETRFREQLSRIDDLDNLRRLLRRAATVADVAQFTQTLAALLTPE